MSASRPEPIRDFFRTPAILLALAAGLLLRVFFLMRFAHIQGDSLLYADIAHNLLRHGIYGITNGATAAKPIRPTLIRLPGYPLFLAACFRFFGVDAQGQERFYPVLVVQILIDLCTCVLVSRLAARLFGSRAGVAALWLAALCPFTANYSVAPLTETLTLFCIAAAFFLLQRWQAGDSRSPLNAWLFLLALTLAYAILLRPEQGLLAAAVVPAVFCISRSFKPAALLAALTLLPLAPWAARNFHTFHVFQPLAPRFATDPGESNPAGFERWYRTWAIDFVSTETVYWNYDGADIDIATLPNRAFDTQAQYNGTASILRAYNVSDTSTPAFDAAFNSLATERIAANPVRYYLALPAARLLNMAFRPRTDMLPVPLEWWRVRSNPRSFSFAVFYGSLNLVYFALAGFALLRRRESWKPHAMLVWAMLATIAMRSALLLTIDNSEPRYTLEFFPVLFVLGSAVITSRRACRE